MVSLGWLGKSIIAMLCFIPFGLAANIFAKHFNAKPEAMIFLWQLGSVVGMSIWFNLSGEKTGIMSPNGPLIFMLVLGLVCGTIGNVFITQAMTMYKNPGVPCAVVGSNSITMTVIGPLLALLIPTYCQHMKFDWRDMISVLLIVVAICNLASRG